MVEAERQKIVNAISKKEERNFLYYVALVLSFPVGVLMGCEPPTRGIDVKPPKGFRKEMSDQTKTQQYKWLPAFLLQHDGQSFQVNDVSLGLAKSNWRYDAIVNYNNSPEEIPEFLRANQRDAFEQLLDASLPFLNLKNNGVVAQLSNNVYRLAPAGGGSYGGYLEDYVVYDLEGVKIAACSSKCSDALEYLSPANNPPNFPPATASFVHEFFHDLWGTGTVPEVAKKKFVKDATLFLSVGGETKDADKFFGDLRLLSFSSTTSYLQLLNDFAEQYDSQSLFSKEAREELIQTLDAYIMARGLFFNGDVVNAAESEYVAVRKKWVEHQFQYFTAYEKLLPDFLLAHYKQYLSEEKVSSLMQSSPYYTDKASFEVFKGIVDEFVVFAKERLQ